MKRSPLRRKTPMKRSRMKRKPAKDSEAARAFREAVLERDRVCRACMRAPATEAHHLKTCMGKRIHDPALGLGLCFECHRGSKRGVHVIGKKAWAKTFFELPYREIRG